MFVPVAQNDLEFCCGWSVSLEVLGSEDFSIEFC